MTTRLFRRASDQDSVFVRAEVLAQEHVRRNNDNAKWLDVVSAQKVVAERTSWMAWGIGFATGFAVNTIVWWYATQGCFA